MNKANILAFLDAEIGRLERARELLSDSDSAKQNGNRRGKGSTGPRRRRHMSAEARRRISEAQKKRWAARKKAGR